jgi:hypothetical protein
MFGSLLDAAWSAIRGVVPGMRAVFVASLLLQLTFQSFTTWYALHGTERFGVPPEGVTGGFIAFVAVLFIPRGAGETDTGPSSAPPASSRSSAPA